MGKCLETYYVNNASPFSSSLFSPFNSTQPKKLASLELDS